MNQLYRIATMRNGGAARVSDTLLTRSEALQSLRTEEALYVSSGWSVLLSETDRLVVRRDDATREVVLVPERR